jgi:hypothetical protein
MGESAGKGQLFNLVVIHYKNSIRFNIFQGLWLKQFSIQVKCFIFYPDPPSKELKHLVELDKTSR